MSRGPGRWQRAILDALSEYEVGDVLTIAYNFLDRDPSRAEMVAARRAVRRLAEDGQVRAIYLGCCVRCAELSERWHCSACGAGCNKRLVVTRMDGDVSKIKSVVSLGRDPTWINVAPDRNAAGGNV